MLFFVEIVMNMLFENKSYSILSKDLFQLIYLFTHLLSLDSSFWRTYDWLSSAVPLQPAQSPSCHDLLTYDRLGYCTSTNCSWRTTLFRRSEEHTQSFYQSPSLQTKVGVDNPQPFDQLTNPHLYM